MLSPRHAYVEDCHIGPMLPHCCHCLKANGTTGHDLKVLFKMKKVL